MEVSQVEKLPPPPGIINSLKAGFDVVAARVSAIFFPLLLDLFIWLGPRLRVSALFDSIKADLISAWQGGGIAPAEIQRALDVYNTIITKLNLFWFLRTIPIGISSLPFVDDGGTPLGAPLIWQVGALGLFGWLFFLNLAGWLGGGLYFRAVSKLTLGANAQPVGFFRAIWQTFFLSSAWSVLAVILLIPLVLILGILTRISPALANFVILFFTFAAMWAVVPLYFWSHGIFVKQQNVIDALLGSWRLSRFTLPGSSLFVLTIFLLSFGLNFLWSVPPSSSWMMLVGILGHAFVTTALLAASFIYYRDASSWLEVALEKFKAGDKQRSI